MFIIYYLQNSILRILFIFKCLRENMGSGGTFFLVRAGLRGLARGDGSGGGGSEIGLHALSVRHGKEIFCNHLRWGGRSSLHGAGARLPLAWALCFPILRQEKGAGCGTRPTREDARRRFLRMSGDPGVGSILGPAAFQGSSLVDCS